MKPVSSEKDKYSIQSDLVVLLNVILPLLSSSISCLYFVVSLDTVTF